MKDFKFTIPQNILFGSGRLQELPSIVKSKQATKILLISDPGLKDIGLVDKVTSLLQENEIEVETFTEVEPNPSTETVNKGTNVFKQSGAELIIAVGGGSSIDVSKAIATLSTYGGKINDYEGADKVPGDVVPLIAIPTNAGTGAEATPFAVITDHEIDYKLTVFSYKLLPQTAILDPDLIKTLPPFVAASTGVDAFIHAMESFISRDANPFTEMMSHKGMELLGKYIRRFVANRQDNEAADGMLLGSLFAGIAFSWARLGNIHAMSHPISAYFDVPHGVANSVLMPTILEYNALTDNGKYKVIYDYIKKDKYESSEPFKASMLIQEIRDLLADLNIPDNLSDVKQVEEAGGISDEILVKMSEDAMKSGNIFANPRASTQKDIERLYRIALEK